LPDGNFDYVTDAAPGGQLQMTSGGTWWAVAASIGFRVGLEHWDFTLAASTAMAQCDPANTGTRTYDADTYGYMATLPSLDTTITIPTGGGIFLIYGKHETNTAGDFGMGIVKNNTTMLTGGNKTAKIGNIADTLTYKSDKIVAVTMAVLAGGDTIDMFGWHSAGSTDHFEMGIMRLPIT
jgi:hypothetical protein